MFGFRTFVIATEIIPRHKNLFKAVIIGTKKAKPTINQTNF